MNFKRYVEASDTWVDSHYIMGTSTDTITTLPVDVYADGTNATVGLKGNMSQTGTPSPTTPIQPSECGERIGNLCLVSQNNSIIYDSFNNYIISNNTVTSTGQALLGFKCKVEPNTSYTVSIKKKTSVDLRIREYNSEPTDWTTDFIIQSLNTNQTSATFTTSQNTTWILVAFWFSTTGHTVYDIMLNAGSTALPYEPYGYKIPISSANTTTPVYLGEVETTRKVKKLVLTGNETVAGSAVTGGWIVTQLSDSINNTAGVQTAYCSHYLSKNNGSMSSLSQGEMCISTQVNNRINFVTTFATAEDFKAYLATQYAAGTPVCVWYVLANEETGIVNEPLRKIGDYADEVSSISIPTIAGANTISVGTTLQPSEVTVNYKGWHPVQSVHEKSKNILPSPQAATKSNNGITVRSDGAGRYYVSGTAENDAYITFNIPPFLIPISVGLNGNGTFSMFNTKTYQNAAVKLEFYYQGTLVDNWGLINLNRTSTNYSAMANRTTDTVGIFVKSGSTVDFQICPEFTNDGVLPTNYEPYWK